MVEEKIFYKICPTKKCKTISGFFLPIGEIKKNNKYFCQECGKESSLNCWKDSNQNDMNKQIRVRKYIKSAELDENMTDLELTRKLIEISGYKKGSVIISHYVKEIKEELNGRN